jgi:TatD DNase family protein
MLVDSHCHLNFPDFKNDLDDVIARAGAAGIGKMVSICTKLEEFAEIAAIADKYPNVYCSVGVHPHDADEKNAAEVKAEDIIKLTAHPKCVGIGETGLDYFYEHSPREEQKISFLEHIKAGRATGLPVIIHTRDAEADTIEIIKQQSGFAGLLHCFTSSYEVAKCGMDNGLYVSISGIVTFKNAVDLRETVKKIPLEFLLVETDSPFLAPLPHRGKRCEPAFTRHTADFIAELKGISVQELEEATTANFHKVFSKVPV